MQCKLSLTSDNKSICAPALSSETEETWGPVPASPAALIISPTPLVGQHHMC